MCWKCNGHSHNHVSACKGFMSSIVLEYYSYDNYGVGIVVPVWARVRQWELNLVKFFEDGPKQPVDGHYANM